MALTAYHAGSPNPNKRTRSGNTQKKQSAGKRQHGSSAQTPRRSNNRSGSGSSRRSRGGQRRFRPPKKRMEQKPETPGIALTAKKKNKKRTYTAPLKKLRVIPLGGLDAVGMNMTIYEYGNDILIVDGGGLFPSDKMPGIDLVIPDITYLVENAHKIRGLVVTHGHEDHMSALPYIMPRLSGVPIYGLPLTIGLIESKFQEFGIKDKPKVVKAGDTLKFGVFTVDLFTLTHTIPDNVGLAIHTPEGIVAHTTDWKFDHTPVWGPPSDYAKLISMAKEGVLLHLNDSTNAEIPGYTVSERVVQQDIAKIFKEHPRGRIIMSSFASNINRIQIAINLSAKTGRKVAVSGRSMERNVNMALKLGYVNAPKDILVDIRKIGNIPDHKLTILCTGSQGEEYSALVRMSSGEHRQIKVKKGDTVVISASRIPGNEHAIFETIDNLFRQGADVVYGGELDIHTSGHAKQEELKMMIAMLQPKYYLPIHGEYRMLKANAKLAAEMGVDPKHIFVGENGAVLEIDRGKAKWSRKIPANHVMIDGLGIGDVGQIVLRDRVAMAEEGIFMVILTVDRRRGVLVSSPDIISRGFVYMRDAKELISKARREVKQMFDRHNKAAPLDWEYVKRELRDELAKLLYDYTQRQPMVIPVVIEV